MPRQTHTIWRFDDIDFNITRRRMKHLKITVLPPDGMVKVSVPYYVNNAEVESFIHERLGWVKEQRLWCLSQPRAKPCELQEGEALYLWGRTLSLAFSPSRSRIKAKVDGQHLVLLTRADTPYEGKLKILETFFRQQLTQRIPIHLAEWEAKLGVRAKEWRIKKMRTRWGSCNINDSRIWLNLDLVRYPELCLRYVVLHELVHLLETNHTRRFWNLVESQMPDWKSAEYELKEKHLAPLF